MDYELIKLILMLLGSAVIGGLLTSWWINRELETQYRESNEVYKSDLKNLDLPELLQRQAD
jgi:hypothetical protein